MFPLINQRSSGKTIYRISFQYEEKKKALTWRMGHFEKASLEFLNLDTVALYSACLKWSFILKDNGVTSDFKQLSS